MRIHPLTTLAATLLLALCTAATTPAPTTLVLQLRTQPHDPAIKAPTMPDAGRGFKDAGNGFSVTQFHDRASKTPTTAPAALPASGAPLWSTDLTVVVDQPFSVKLTDGDTTTTLKGTVHPTDPTHYRVHLSFDRATVESSPGNAVPMVNRIRFTSTAETTLSKDASLSGFFNSNGAGEDYVVSLTPYQPTQP